MRPLLRGHHTVCWQGGDLSFFSLCAPPPCKLRRECGWARDCVCGLLICLLRRAQGSAVLCRWNINYINNINMASIMGRAGHGIKMRRLDNTVLMTIVGDGIRGDLQL